MSASKTRLIIAAAVLLLLALAGDLGWQRVRGTSPHVEMLASAPAHGSSSATPAHSTATPDPDATATPSDPASPPPSFDVVRVEPSGDALLAGHGKPDGTVALIDHGKVVAEVKADAGGSFVITPPALKPGDYALTLRQGEGAATQESKQSVVVSVPASKSQQVVVAMAEPGKATTLLSVPPQATALVPRSSPAAAAAPKTAASGAPPKLAIRSVELENGSGLFASGLAPPGTDVRVYLNNSRVADVAAAPAGAWTVTVRKGLAAGHYAVRADALKPDHSVDARVEVPFDVPRTEATGTEPATLPPDARLADAGSGMGNPATEPTTSPPGVKQPDAVLDHVDTELVSRGDNLWGISRKRLGHGTRYTEIYAANVTQIRDPKLVYPGQVFVLPRD